MLSISNLCGIPPPDHISRDTCCRSRICVGFLLQIMYLRQWVLTVCQGLLIVRLLRLLPLFVSNKLSYPDNHSTIYSCNFENCLSVHLAFVELASIAFIFSVLKSCVEMRFKFWLQKLPTSQPDWFLPKSQSCAIHTLPFWDSSKSKNCWGGWLVH